MSEIEKLMQNAGIEKAPDINNCYPEMMKCHHCKHYKVIDEYTGRCLNEVYPEFTAEKQLELMKTILNKGYRKISYYITRDGDYSLTFYPDVTDPDSVHYVTWGNNIAEVLADLVNFIWNDIEDTEKAEIKRILE